MPELPEVETMVRGIRPHVEGCRIESVEPCECPCRPIATSPEWPAIAEAAVGRRIERVWRRAKRVVLSLEDDWRFVIEPRMTGLMLVTDPPDAGHLRVRWELSRPRGGSNRSRDVGSRDETRRSPDTRPSDGHSDLLFWDRRGLGTMRLYAPGEMDRHLADRLGPDALEMTLDQWQDRLARTQREVKVALLDQKLVAGIGNLYASEILYRSRIDPRTPAARISRNRLSRLHEATTEILHEAIRYEGSTLGDGTYRNALNQDGSYQNAHRVYAREGEPCPGCGRKIKRIVQAQRSTFFCSSCQRR